MTMLVWFELEQTLRVLHDDRPDFPYLAVPLFGAAGEAEQFLERAARAADVQPVLVDALRPWAAGMLPVYSDAVSLRQAAARAIGMGLIHVAQTLPANLALTFDAAYPTAPRQSAPVRVASRRAGLELLRRCAPSEATALAVRQALSHPASLTWTGAPAVGVPTGSWMDRCVELLISRALLVIPDARLGGAMRLAWAELPALQSSAIAPAPAPEPPPRRRASPPPPPPPPPAELPPPAPTASPQALALQEAAEAGTPFCEECARAEEEEMAGG